MWFIFLLVFCFILIFIILGIIEPEKYVKPIPKPTCPICGKVEQNSKLKICNKCKKDGWE